METEEKVDAVLSEKSNTQNDFDTPWKDILRIYFKEFMALCYPDLYSKIDWSRGYKMLDKELHKISRKAPIGNRVADKLIEVYTKEGEATVIWIHVEIQATAKAEFEKRMLVFRYRLRDLYGESIVSMAILIDKNPNWRPTGYKETCWGTSLEVQFSIVKLIDFKERIPELEASTNPFASVILAQLSALEKQSPDVRFQSKIALTRRLYNQGFQKEDILQLYRFLDWVLALPVPLEIQYNETIGQLEEEKGVAYITSVERIGIEKGIQEGMRLEEEKRAAYVTTAERIGIQKGVKQGESTVLMRLLQHKFSMIPEMYRQQIEQANTESLLIWAERVLDSQTLEEIFKN